MSYKQMRKLAFFTSIGDVDSAYALINRARQKQIDKEREKQLARFRRAHASDPVGFAGFTPEEQEAGRGEQTNKGRLDIQRSLSYGGAEPDASALAENWGVPQRMAEARAVGVPPVDPHHGDAVLAYLDNMHPGDLQRLVPRLRGESDSRWRLRAKVAIREEQNAALKREMIERAKNTGLDPKAHERLHQATRVARA
jgi:hypothetical protein